MKHVPVLLCGAVLSVAAPIQAGADDATHDVNAASRNTQRVARLDAPPSRTALSGAAVANVAPPGVTPPGVAPPGVAATRASGDSADETACLAMVADDPDGALDRAEDWARHGGADAAARCRALASIALGDPDAGAVILDGVSHDAALPVPRRARAAAEASRAWLLAARPQQALAASSLAMALDPAPDYAIDQARAALGAHQPALAIQDLSPVLATHADLSEALVVRASALRQTGALDRARIDIEAACRLEPDAPEALLERGILRERLGDLEGARMDWSRVIAAAPDTHEADLAQQDLALLDAGPEAR